MPQFHPLRRHQHGEDGVVGASGLRSRWWWEKRGGESSGCSSCARSRRNRPCWHTEGRRWRCLRRFLSFQRRGETAGAGDGAVEALTWALRLAGARQRWGVSALSWRPEPLRPAQDGPTLSPKCSLNLGPPPPSHVVGEWGASVMWGGLTF